MENEYMIISIINDIVAIKSNAYMNTMNKLYSLYLDKEYEPRDMFVCIPNNSLELKNKDLEQLEKLSEQCKTHEQMYDTIFTECSYVLAEIANTIFNEYVNIDSEISGYLYAYILNKFNHNETYMYENKIFNKKYAIISNNNVYKCIIGSNKKEIVEININDNELKNINSADKINNMLSIIRKINTNTDYEENSELIEKDFNEFVDYIIDRLEKDDIII